MSLAEGREFFHHRCIMGGFDNRPQGVLYSGTKEEVQSYTKGLVTAIGKKGYIVGADCTFPRDVDVNRFTWVKDTLKEL